MPKIQDTRLAACDPGRSRKKLEKSSEFHWEFQGVWLAACVPGLEQNKSC